jgi:p-cumate 2,3-dioxygenase alpha subunit
MQDQTDRELLDGLVIDDVARGIFRVNRRSFVDHAILVQERRRVFERSWLYVGHESEIPQAGSFIRRKVAGRWIIFLRDQDGDVRVFFDSCTHRGNSVCRGNTGVVKRFHCFYHGWTFNTRGDLIGVPDRSAYGAAFDMGQLGLKSPQRLGAYRGLVFLSFDPEIADLVTYLGNAREYIDLMLDFSPTGLEIARGQQSYSIRANWKLLVENSADVYHALVTHKRYFVDFLRDLGGNTSDWNSQMQDVPGNAGYALDNGHAVMETPVGPLPVGVKGAEHLAAARQRLEQIHGPERTHRILDYSRNIVIFPNLVFVANFRTVRTFYPVSPDLIEVNAWALLPKDEPPELRELRLDNFLSFMGPGGFATPDDVEALENCQRSFAAAGEVIWSDISRGMLRDRPLGSDELQMRNFWRRWYQLLNINYVPGREPATARAAP